MLSIKSCIKFIWHLEMKFSCINELRHTWHVFEILVSYIMKVAYGTYELCEILMKFMSYVFEKTLEWKNSYFVIRKLWKILFKNFGVFDEKIIFENVCEYFQRY
jgi:hypothetical protein